MTAVLVARDGHGSTEYEVDDERIEAVRHVWLAVTDGAITTTCSCLRPACTHAAAAAAAHKLTGAQLARAT